MESQLIIPQRPRTEIAAGFNRRVRREVARVVDIDAIEEIRRRLAAFHAYVTKREQRVELDGAARWCEIRIGELLGKGEAHRPKKTSLASEINGKPPRGDRHKFRRLAEFKELITPLIERGTVSRAKLLAAIKEATTPPPPAIGKTYSVLLADPPWQYDFAESDRRTIGKEYPTMSAADLSSLSLPACKNAVLYLWATAPKLAVAIGLLAEWGFEYKTCAVWDKEKIGMGYWFRGQHELLLVATCGSFSPPAPAQRASSVIRSPRGRHSQKPPEVYKLIERAFPTNTKVELFARSAREGWDSWGNEL